MGNIGWKLRSWFQQMIPLLIVGTIAWGGYSLYREGVFRRGLKPAMTSVLRKVPYFGSRFSHYRPHRKSYSVARNSRSYRRSYGHKSRGRSSHRARHHRGRSRRRR